MCLQIFWTSSLGNLIATLVLRLKIRAGLVDPVGFGGFALDPVWMLQLLCHTLNSR